MFDLPFAAITAASIFKYQLIFWVRCTIPLTPRTLTLKLATSRTPQSGVCVIGLFCPLYSTSVCLSVRSLSGESQVYSG